jgi:hypothetical protein
MDHGLQVRVVEVQHVRADSINQRGVQDIHPLSSAEQARLVRSRERSERPYRDLDGFMLRAADRAARPVDERAARLGAHGRRQIAGTGFEDVGRERASDVRRRICGWRGLGWRGRDGAGRQ